MLTKQQIQSLTREEANNLCFSNGIRNENYNIVGRIFWERINGVWKEIKDFRGKEWELK